MISPGAGWLVAFSGSSARVDSPNGIQQPSPLQRQWISWLCSGSRPRMATTVCAAPSTHCREVQVAEVTLMSPMAAQDTVGGDG